MIVFMYVLIAQVYKMPFIKWLFIFCERREKPQASGKVVNFEVFKVVYLPLQCTACIFLLLIFLGKYSWVH